jgi:hypothetical protein
LPTRKITIVLVAVAAIAFTSPDRLDSQRIDDPGGPSFECGSNVTPDEARRYLEQVAGGPGLVPPELLPQAGPYCVPIVGHIVRQSDGTGGMSLSQYQQSVADANSYFAGTDIFFYSLGIDYIDSDFYYSDMDTRTINDINALRSENVFPAAINVYYTPNLPGLCGISSFTFSPVQGIVMANGCSGVPSNPSTMPHEIGHYFDLFHTHETAFGTEYVNGSNCGTAGDRLCDTPADPRLGSHNINAVCLYFGAETDPLGAPYTPDPRQIMSYSRSLCRDVFSPASQSKMVTTILNLRPELLQRGCSAVPPPTLSEVAPGDGFADQSLDILLVGTNFRQFTYIDLGPGVTVNTADTLSSDDSLLVNITVDIDAAEGLRDVIVDNAFEPDTLFGGFEILGTPRHYVSPTGANVYPYGRPADAATDLEIAIAAAGDGDSVLVDTAAIDFVDFLVTQPLVISGGWMNGFTYRDLASVKTTFNLNGNILLAASSGTCGLDGIRFINGHGAPDIAPIIGDYGGAVRIASTDAVITNCEFYMNEATAGLGFGGGGAVYAVNSTVEIANSEFSSNTATHGGAVYLYNSTGELRDNLFEVNTVAAGGTEDPLGGAVAVQACTGVTFTGNTFISNTGAQSGGALWITGSTGITVDGGSVTGCTAVQYGGGAHVSGSEAAFTGVEFIANDAQIAGGAVSTGDTSNAAIGDCVFQGNSGKLGGAVYASTGTVNVSHNEFTQNTASITAGALYVSNLAGGAIVSNTADDNNGGAAVGGFLLSTSPVTVTNNIVVNSTGHGMSCNGGSATLSYNLVWNSSGDDYNGCSPGAGAVTADPLLVDVLNGDYHLTLASPAIDTGDPSPSFDDLDGSRGDMGRFGSHPSVMDQPSYPKGLASNISGEDLVLTWSQNPEGAVSFYAVFCDTVAGFNPATDNFVTTSTDTSVTFPAPPDTTWYVICAVDTSGYSSGYSAEVMSAPDIGTAVGDVVRLTNSLHQNVPNPFNPSTAIRYSIAERVRVTIRIYDVAGRLVRTLANEDRSPNVYTVVWDGANDAGQSVSSGIYFYRITAGSFVQTKKMVLLK